jgi:hypothetical protein
MMRPRRKPGSQPGSDRVSSVEPRIELTGQRGKKHCLMPRPGAEVDTHSAMATRAVQVGK